MKKLVFITLLISLIAFGLYGCGDGGGGTAKAEAEVKYISVNTDFDYRITSDGGAILIDMYPSTTGSDGDGFLVTNWKGEYYFVPEGQRIILPGSKRYHMHLSRAYQTDRGLVIGETQRIPLSSITVGEVWEEGLPLERYTGKLYSWMLQPSVIADLKKGNLYVNPFIYEGPPVLYDNLEVTFSGFIRSGITPATFLIDGQGGEVTVPSEGFKYCSAVPIIKDEAKGRIIKGQGGRIEFKN